MDTKLNYSRKILSTEKAIILTAFIITISAFSFILLNVGFLTENKTPTNVINNIETISGIIAEPNVTGYFNNTTLVDQDDVCLEKILFYIKIEKDHEPVDCSHESMVITYTNQRCYTVVYSNSLLNGTITTLQTITGDTDSLLEPGEKMQVSIDFSKIDSADVKPVPTQHTDIYGKPYETIRIEIRPIVGAILTIEKEIPVVNAPVMTLR